MRTHFHLAQLLCCAAIVLGMTASDAYAAPNRSQIATVAANVGLSLTANRNGLVVTGVGQTAASAGFRVGDLVVAVNGQRVATPGAFWARIVANQGGNEAQMQRLQNSLQQQKAR